MRWRSRAQYRSVGLLEMRLIRRHDVIQQLLWADPLGYSLLVLVAAHGTLLQPVLPASSRLSSNDLAVFQVQKRLFHGARGTTPLFIRPTGKWALQAPAASWARNGLVEASLCALRPRSLAGPCFGGSRPGLGAHSGSESHGLLQVVQADVFQEIFVSPDVRHARALIFACHDSVLSGSV